MRDKTGNLRIQACRISSIETQPWVGIVAIVPMDLLKQESITAIKPGDGGKVNWGGEFH